MRAGQGHGISLRVGDARPRPHQSHLPGPLGLPPASQPQLLKTGTPGAASTATSWVTPESVIQRQLPTLKGRKPCHLSLSPGQGLNQGGGSARKCSEARPATSDGELGRTVAAHVEGDSASVPPGCSSAAGCSHPAPPPRSPRCSAAAGPAGATASAPACDTRS